MRGGNKMTKREKAEIILESLDNGHMNINWNLKDGYLNDIVKALKTIEERENQ